MLRAPLTLTTSSCVAWLAFGRGHRRSAVQQCVGGGRLGKPSGVGERARVGDGARGIHYGSSSEEFISGGSGGSDARSLVAYCFSVSDDFRFGSAQRALTQAYAVPSRIFFSEVVHMRVKCDAVPTWPSEAVDRLGNDEAPPSLDDESTATGGSGVVGDLHARPGGAGYGAVPFPGGGGGSGAAVIGGRVREAVEGESYGDVFLFRDGSLVLWGIDPHAEHALLALLETFRPLQSDEASLSSIKGEDRGALEEASVGVSRETLQVLKFL